MCEAWFAADMEWGAMPPAEPHAATPPSYLGTKNEGRGGPRGAHLRGRVGR